MVKEIIDKKLVPKMAELDDIKSNKSCSKHGPTHSEVADWLEKTYQEQQAQPALEYGHSLGEPCFPAQGHVGTDEGSFYMLAKAIRDLTLVTTAPEASLLTGNSTPKDLPMTIRTHKSTNTTHSGLY